MCNILSHFVSHILQHNISTTLLLKLNIKYEIVFACDTGERYIYPTIFVGKYKTADWHKKLGNTYIQLKI